MTVRVGVVDDHPVVVSGLEAVLGGIEDFEVVARAGTIADAEALLARDDLDVVLMDVRLPDGNGLELLERTAGARRVAVIVLSSFETVQYVATVKRILQPLGTVLLDLRIQRPDGTLCVDGKTTCVFKK